MLTDEKNSKIEAQINELRKLVDYITLEYPIEVIVNKYKEGNDDDANEIYIPQYQRDFVWDDARQSKFIESLFLGLPIPFMFLADATEGRLEIVDGSQRIRTLANYIDDGLKLTGLLKLKELNGTLFSELIVARKRRFLRTNIRIILLTEKADDEARKDIFERINTSSDILRPMEVRTGIMEGSFSDFIQETARNELFKKLAPVSDRLAKRKEREELVLRFFAYFNQAHLFEHRVDQFIDNYLTKMNKEAFDVAIYKTTFVNMLSFIEKTLPLGFKKTSNAKSTPRVRFETLAVGAALALKENPQLVCKEISWLESEEFKNHTRSDGSNSKTKLQARLNYAKNKFLGK